MTDISDLLLNYFLLSTNLIETLPNPPSKTPKEVRIEISRMVLEDSYVPLFSIDKIKYLKNFVVTYNELKKRSDEILSLLGVEANLPSPYKVTIALQLSILEGWWKIAVERYVFSRKTEIVKGSLDISPNTLLILYKFIILSKFSSYGKRMVDLLETILSSSKYSQILTFTYSEIKKIIDYVSSGRRQQSIGPRKRAYSMFNTIYAPLILSYVLNGAGLARFESSKNETLSYSSTVLADLLSHYAFKIIFGYNVPTLQSLAQKLVEYFTVIHKILSNEKFRSVLKEGTLYHFLIVSAKEHGITDDERIAHLWSLLNDIIVAMLVSLELYEEDDEIRRAYKEKVGDIDLYEYTLKQYGLTY